MKSICLIGNSHLGALKHGAEVLGPVDGATFEFYGCANGYFREFDVAGGKVTPKLETVKRSWRATSNGREAIDLSRFDVVAVAGFAGLNGAFKLASRYITPPMRDQDGRQLVSTDLWLELLRFAMTNEAGTKLAIAIAGATGKPVRMLPRPRMARAVLATSTRLSRLHASGDSERLMRLYDRACKDLSPGVEVLPQPTGTISDHLFTHDDFSVGALGLAEGKALSEVDVNHMNPLYGATVLRDLLTRIGIITHVDLLGAARAYDSRRMLENRSATRRDGAGSEHRQRAREQRKAERAINAQAGEIETVEFVRWRERLDKIDGERAAREQARAAILTSRSARALEIEARRASRQHRQAARAEREASNARRRSARAARLDAVEQLRLAQSTSEGCDLQPVASPDEEPSA